MYKVSHSKLYFVRVVTKTSSNEDGSARRLNFAGKKAYSEKMYQNCDEE